MKFIQKSAVSFLAVVLIAMPAAQAEHVLKGTRSKAVDTETLMKLREGMHQIEASFITMQENADQKAIDYDEILKAANQMDEAIRKTRMNQPEATLDASLKELSGSLSGVRKYAKSQNPMKLREKLDGLYDQCFRCHATHAPLL